MDVRGGGKWTLSQTWNGGFKTLGSVLEEHGGLKQNVFYGIRVELKRTERGRKVTVYANGISLFNEVAIANRDEKGDEEGGDGDFGVMCKGCR